MTLLDIQRVSVAFESPGDDATSVVALDDVNLSIARNETLALIGESGAGKSTLARSLAGLISPDEGRINFDGHDLGALGRSDLRAVRRRIGLIFQDSASALNPRRRIIDIVAAPLANGSGLSRNERRSRAREALERVDLPSALDNLKPGQLSGGQRQRVGLARAIVNRPELLICDEPLAGLDLMTEAGMLELLRETTVNTACLFVTHDLFVAAAIGDRIAVMEKGRIVEEGPAREIVSRPTHPHTQALIAAIPPADPDRGWQDRHGIVAGDQPPFEAAT